MTRWLDRDEQRAWRGLLAMNAQLMARLNRALQDTSGLSLADYDVLVALTDVPGRSRRYGDLADALQWEKSRLSKQVTRMAARGLVVRREAEGDRRGAYVELTDAGLQAIEAAAPDHVDLVSSLVFEGLSRSDVKALARITRTVLERMEGEAAEPAAS